MMDKDKILGPLMALQRNIKEPIAVTLIVENDKIRFFSARTSHGILGDQEEEEEEPTIPLSQAKRGAGICSLGKDGGYIG